MTEPVLISEPVICEPGASWKTVAIGPVFCVVILISEWAMELPVHWWVLAILALILAGFSALQIGAARTHTSVLLTKENLRQGTELLAVKRIKKVFPASEDSDAAAHEGYIWQSARALGELTGVPRGRKGIGLKLDDGTVVQAWAKKPEQLRTELVKLVK
ncbi:MAG: hypothetical protein ACRCSF_00075 [Mycobacteriaceae bacterium]